MALPPELKPVRKLRVMDLAEEAGLDVSDWSNYANGQRNPGANPKYCYEWALSDPGRLVVCNLWHRDMRETANGIEQHLSLVDSAANANEDSTRRARRARMHAQLRAAYRDGVLIRAIVIDGKKAEDSKNEKARIEARKLDPIPWAVTSIDPNSGMVILLRGALSKKFSDQFALPKPPDGKATVKSVTTIVRERSAEVRSYALCRAGGKCEYCGEPGFVLNDGSIYLETHHLIALSRGGPDSAGNVVALCPNHHREAHYGSNAKMIYDTLATKLSS